MLYATASDASTYEMFSGAQTTYTYHTGNLTEGAYTNLKLYDELYFVVTGTHTVKVYIYTILVNTFTLTEQTTPIRLAVPQEFQRGSAIRFELSGIGTIKEIEYKAQGRQNGK